MRRWIFALLPLAITFTLWFGSYWRALYIVSGRNGAIIEQGAVYITGERSIDAQTVISLRRAEPPWELDAGSTVNRWLPIRKLPLKPSQDPIVIIQLWVPMAVAGLFALWVRPWRRQGMGRGFSVNGLAAST